jgi:hypothetical protein
MSSVYNFFRSCSFQNGDNVLLFSFTNAQSDLRFVMCSFSNNCPTFYTSVNLHTIFVETQQAIVEVAHEMSALKCQTLSIVFTESNTLTSSDLISPSKSFSKSGVFSPTKGFSKTSSFSQTNSAIYSNRDVDRIP